MKHTFTFSTVRCAIASLLGWAMFGFAVYMWFTWRNPDIGAYFGMGLIALVGAGSGMASARFMFNDYPVYILNQRGLIVRQTLNPRLHYRINWCDIESIRITRGKHKQLLLKIKDGGKQYFHEQGRTAYAKQKLKFNRTTEILAMAPVIEGGMRGLHRTLMEYWQDYRD